MKVKITFTEPLLGTISGNREITEEFIASKNPNGVDPAEIEAIPLDETIEKSSTIFARNPDGKPMLWDYQIKGFFKEVCLAMIEHDLLTQKELKDVRLTSYLYKRTIDKQIFIFPRQILIQGLDSEPLKFTERPLRGQTQRGERICLARSETIPAGASIVVEIRILNKKLEPFIPQWLTYGILSGLGQWRNSGCGRFSWELITE